MSEFEKWFADQDFYTNMRFIHGDNLFGKDGDMYRVLPVQMTYVAWSEKHVEYAELRQVSVALNTETINQRRYIVSKQSEIDQLKAEKAGLEKAIDDEIKRCLHSADAPIRDEHDKGWRNAMLSVVSSFKKLRGGDQNTKNSIQVIESNANRGGDQNGEH